MCKYLEKTERPKLEEMKTVSLLPWLLSVCVTLSLFISPVTHATGEEAVMVYSRDDSCTGQEMIRAFTQECKEFYSNDDAMIDYFQFHCEEETNTFFMEQYYDKNCQKSTGNRTILFQSTVENGICQQVGYEHQEGVQNYHSIQLFCKGISSIKNPKTFFTTFKTEKIMFRHYTNSDDTCADKPAVIELVGYPFPSLSSFPPSFFLSLS